MKVYSAVMFMDEGKCGTKRVEIAAVDNSPPQARVGG